MILFWGHPADGTPVGLQLPAPVTHRRFVPAALTSARWGAGIAADHPKDFVDRPFGLSDFEIWINARSEQSLTESNPLYTLT
jgi:hypothetical protein